MAIVKNAISLRKQLKYQRYLIKHIVQNKGDAK